MKQFIITPAAGKRLIGRGMVVHPSIERVLDRGTLAIIAGTTNGYVAEEILSSIGQGEGFRREGFRRGVTTGIGASVPAHEFFGDVVIKDGRWQKGLTVFDVTDDLQQGDVVLKGANAVDPWGHAAVQVAHPKGGTILAVLPAVVGRRVELIVPVGLEKRILEDVHELAARTNVPGAEGPRLLPMPGSVFTEIDAIGLLTDVEAWMLAAGGVYGAEGSVWLGISGTQDEVQHAALLLESIAGEPLCRG
ncbi:hypothetical protein JXA88_17940 [Candidatus Fermentibacteria bacterium]|nr:hypothetical protein [Candidatus Fermentibacteria bacterium]